MAKGGKGKKTLTKEKGGARSRKDDGEDEELNDASGAGDGLGDNLLGLGSVKEEAADHAQATVTQGWGWASDRKSTAKSPDSNPDPTTLNADVTAWPKEWASPGPATVRGGAGGGWDIASSLHGGGGSSASGSVVGQSTTTTTRRQVATFTETKKAGKRTNKLSTVMETQTISHGAPSESDRSSMASGAANANMAALGAAVGRGLPSGASDRGSRVSSEGRPQHSTTLAMARRVSDNHSSPARSVNPTVVLSGYTRSPAPSAMPLPQPPINHISFARTPSTIAERHRELQTGVQESPRASAVYSLNSNPSSPAPRHPSVISASPSAALPATPPSKSPAKQGHAVRTGKSIQETVVDSNGRTTFMQVSYSGGGPQPSVVGMTSSSTGDSKLQVFVPSGGKMQMPSPRPASTTLQRANRVTAHIQTPLAEEPGMFTGGFPTADAGPSIPQPMQETVEVESIHVRQEKVDSEWVPGGWSTSGGGNGLVNGQGDVFGWPDVVEAPPRPKSDTSHQRTASAPAITRPHLPQSQSLQRALSPTSYPLRPEPTHDARIQETGGLALKPAQRAMFGRHRHATERFFWNLPPDHDGRVEGLLDWVATMGWALGSLGLSKYLQWRQRGALFANADFRPWKSPEEPAFDWMTFDEMQNTLDKTVQESIATYDPSTTVLVFVFLVSKSGSSLGIWRRKVPIPPSLQLKHAIEVNSVKRELARKQLVVKVERPVSARQAIPVSPPPPPPPTKKTGKRKWWQFWKSDREGNTALGKENVRPRERPGRSKLAKRR